MLTNGSWPDPDGGRPGRGDLARQRFAATASGSASGFRRFRTRSWRPARRSASRSSLTGRDVASTRARVDFALALAVPAG